MDRLLAKALTKILAEKTFDCSGYDVDVIDYDEVSFEKGSFETKTTPSTPAVKKVRINSVFIDGLEQDQIEKGDKLKFNFLFTDDEDCKFFIKDEIAIVDRIKSKINGLQVYTKDFYVTWVGDPIK